MFKSTTLILLGKAFTHRLTILFTIGPSFILILFYGISQFDGPSMPGFSLLRFVLFVVAAILWSVYTSARLISGAWSLRRWARLGYYLGYIHVLLFAFACAGTGRYWPAAGFVYFNASLAFFGFMRLFDVPIFILVFSGAFFGTQYLELPQVFAQDLFYNISVLCGASLGLLWIVLGSGYYRNQDETIRGLLRGIRKDRRLIAEERKKSDSLLLNILPASVASELKETGKNKPVFYESTSVMFTDFKGFTKIAETLTPEELVSELDKCFSYFDSLTERHLLEKLKTIGDSYMCAGGIPDTNQTHAVDCVLAALEIQAFMKQMGDIKHEQGLEYWELRLGIHSGPLVAGVIGEKKFAYDVWSDTVNTAARCEAAGAVGKVNISHATYELVHELFECEYRGKVPAKNKGEIEMYFVKNIRRELSRDGQGRVPSAKFMEIYNQL